MDRFKTTISNEEVSQLPAIQFGRKTTIIDTDKAVAEACRTLCQSAVIGFDTETRPSFKAGVINKVALLQLSTATECYLFRLNRIKLDREILRLLESDTILKIGVDIKGDLRALKSLRHFKERGFVDLQNLVSEYGIEERSLRKISSLVLGRRVSKAQRLSNWEAAQFTPQQITYAATDAWVCVEIYDKLIKQKQSR